MDFQREKPGQRLDFGGMDLVHPVDLLPPGKFAFCQNIRRYIKGGIIGRNLLTGALYTLSASLHTIRRLNDSTPNGPPSGYSIINGAGTVLSLWNTTIGVSNVASGLSGNPVSVVPFRPNASVQTYGYVADSAAQGQVTLDTQYLISGDPVSFVSNGMMKVTYWNDNGVSPVAICWKMGIKEPQLAPVVSTQNTSVTTTGTLEATTVPWNNYSGANASYDFGQTDAYTGQPGGVPPFDGTAPFVVDVQNASFITIDSITGVATVNGNAAATPTTPGPVTSTYPAYFIQAIGTGDTPPVSATIITGAFTDGAGNVVPVGVAPLFIPSVVDVGAVIGVTNGITVPYGAVAFQIGIDSSGNTFNSNSGSFAITITVTTDALPTVTSILGNLTAYYWGDSPTSGPVASYIWKNPDDPGGSGPTRSISNAVGNTTGNSFIFDATFTDGIPALPGIGTEDVPMEWTILNPQSVAVGTNPVFAAPITATYPTNTNFSNFNFCLFGNIYFPAAGHYTFNLTNHDDIIWGIGGGVTLVSATSTFNGGGTTPALSSSGQTITVAQGYPLLPRGPYESGEGGDYATASVIVNVPTAGIYPIEVDYDYWFHSGRILLIDASPMPGGEPTIIPPLPASVRQEVQYRYVYRSSATGAQSNPSPESAQQTIPVVANTITSFWSPDPQVDVVDYYRIDSVTAEFTYVNTGPNDDADAVDGTNTPVTDSLTDTELGDQLLSYDNYEPFPSIDLPQKGTLNSSGGVLTWVSGGAIGGSSTGFNIRWLAGTEILIGSPTSLAYTFIARPTSPTSVTIPGVPDGENLAYEIPEPILAAQPLPYMWGPTDNINFAYAVGDPLRPGTLYWCAGSNLDSAPDTNQQDVTDPGEPLVNGAITGGLGVVFSIKRAWLILPNFFNAVATATGVAGSTWSLQESGITRGLYIPRCVVVTGGGNIFFRVDDGIHISPGGAASQSITDNDLFPLFQHENSAPPVAITIAGYTIYPPDDTQPQLQRFSYQNGYLYWDYVGIDSNPHTLVFDEQAGGWVLDVYTPPATIHAPDEGPSVGNTLVGCSDFTARLLSSGGAEAATAVLLTPAFDAGDTRAIKKFGDLYIESTNP